MLANIGQRFLDDAQHLLGDGRLQQEIVLIRQRRQFDPVPVHFTKAV